MTVRPAAMEIMGIEGFPAPKLCPTMMLHATPRPTDTYLQRRRAFENQMVTLQFHSLCFELKALQTYFRFSMEIGRESCRISHVFSVACVPTTSISSQSDEDNATSRVPQTTNQG